MDNMARLPSENPTYQTAFRIPADLLEMLDSIAKLNEVSRSRVLVTLLRTQLNMPEPAPAELAITPEA